MNIDICRALKDVFDKDINLLVPDAEKQDQSCKVNSAANDVGIFEVVNQEKNERGGARASHILPVF